MNTKNIIIIIVIIVLIGIGAWVLLGGEKAISPGEEEEEEEEEEAESLTDVLAKMKGLTSYKYDMVMTASGYPSMTTKFWREGLKVRYEATYEEENVVYLINKDEQLAYMYVPAQNIAMKMDFEQTKFRAEGSIVEQLRSREMESTEEEPVTAEEIGEIIGKEVLDGKNCLVVESSTETEEVKMWFWTKYGIPIRMEITTDEGTIVTEVKNIEIGDIPDSMFELPAEVQIIEIP